MTERLTRYFIKTKEGKLKKLATKNLFFIPHELEKMGIKIFDCKCKKFKENPNIILWVEKK